MSNSTSSNTSNISRWLWWIAGLGFLAYAASFFRTGLTSDRVANTEVTGVPRPVEFLLADSGLDFVMLSNYFTVVTMALVAITLIVAWRRSPGHPYVLMAIASTAIVWQDPMMNWAPYAVYNPELWHLPEWWPYVSISPTVEPFIVIGYAMFYFFPFFPAIWVLRRLQAKRPMDAFVWRHPLWSLAGLILVIGFVFDMMLEITLVRTGLYIYSQVIPWGSLFAGTTFQFPLIWESTFVCFVMIPAGVLCYRDDTGKTVAEKMSQRLRFLQRKPVLATFLVMFGILNISYFLYGAAFGIIRASGIATAVACPYPYPEAKVYDPQGYYERNGTPGPFFAGKGSGFMTGQPEGRPSNNPLVEYPNHNCSPEKK